MRSTCSVQPGWLPRGERRLLRRLAPAAAAALAALAGVSGCSGSGSPGTPSGAGPALTVVVSAPLSSEPWVGSFMRNGAELAARRIDGVGGITRGGTRYRLTVSTQDNGGSAGQALAIARQAVADGAVSLVTDGTGAAAVSTFAARHQLPVFIVFQGGGQLIDPRRWPTTYRIAPADAPMAMRLADYLAGRHPRAALLSDPTEYGEQGAVAMAAGLTRDGIPIPYRATVPADATDVTTQVLAARRAGATVLAVWASPAIVAEVVQAARQAGWQVPIWTGPTGEDPLVRQRLAAHPQWLTGVGFVSFRITAEVGPRPFETFRRAYDAAFGEQRVGVRQDGRPVVQPPDWAMFPYDTVRLVAAALRAAPPGAPPTSAAVQREVDHGLVITAANGDERGFSPTNHEGVSQGDMYFATFHGFTFAPVTDDPLSQGLPQVPQLG